MSDATDTPTADKPDSAPRDAVRALLAAHRRILALGLEPYHVAPAAVCALALALLEHPGIAPSDVLTILCESDPVLNELSAHLRGVR